MDMTNKRVSDRILKGIYRKSPKYKLVRFENLDDSLKMKLNDLQKNPDFYGVLVPMDDESITLKAVNKETALFLLSLTEASQIPNYIINHKKKEIVPEIMGLLLDNIIELNIDGNFRAGSAMAGIFQSEPEKYVPKNFLCKLSYDAIKYAQTLQISDAAMLAARMYFYNRFPYSQNWKIRYTSTDASCNPFVLINQADTIKDIKYWKYLGAKGKLKGWLYWQKKHFSFDKNVNNWTYKLYVSPEPQDLKKMLEICIPIFTQTNTLKFKVGADLMGILRPDKIIAYYESKDDLFEAAGMFDGKLEDVTSHGVPFSYQLDENGVISYGIDPPNNEKALEWMDNESWRVWIANRLAVALLQAKSENTSKKIEPWIFALERLKKDKVDIQTWKPQIQLESENG